MLLPSPASASFLSPEMEDVVADWLTVFVLILVPVVGISLFWMVHILPEQIAPQAAPSATPRPSARCACCRSSSADCSWPIAWIWAYTKPVMHQMAQCGTDKHDDYLAGARREAAALEESAAVPAVLLRRRAAAGGAEKH